MNVCTYVRLKENKEPVCIIAGDCDIFVLVNRVDLYCDPYACEYKDGIGPYDEEIWFDDYCNIFPEGALSEDHAIFLKSEVFNQDDEWASIPESVKICDDQEKYEARGDVF